MAVRKLSPAAGLAVVVAVSAVARFLLARRVPTPWIAPDEMLYTLLGRNLYAHGWLGVFGHDVGFYSLVYPALAGLPLSLGDVGLGYALLKAVQAVVMSLAAVPVYLWGRTLMRPRYALAAAALTVAIPGLAYTGMVMTENAFYPVFVLAAWAAARALERPTAGRQALLAAAIVLAAATRLQALVLLPAVLTAALAKALLERDARPLRRLWPFAAAVVALAVAGALRGAGSLGGYAVVAHDDYRLAEVAKFVAYHAAATLLLCGVVPACALALLAVDAVRGRERSPAARAYLAVAVSFGVWIVVEVGVFASHYAEGVVERDLLGLAPLLFLGLGVWLDRGAPRPYVPSAAIAFCAGALLLALPYDRFVAVTGIQDSMTFAAALQLPDVDPLLLVGVPAVALAALFAVLPRRAAPASAVLLLAAFVAASAAASSAVRGVAAGRVPLLLGGDPRWIDHAATGPVAFVFQGGSFFTTVWTNAFWNRRIAAVYDLPGAHVAGPMPQRTLAVGGDGRLAIDERYAVLPSFVSAAGTPVASATLVGADVPELTLWRLAAPPRLLEERGGFLPNGDVPSVAHVREFACERGGTFLVTLFGKTDQTVRLLVEGRVASTVRLGPNEARQAVVHLPAGRRDDCVLTIRPSSLVGVTQIVFARG